MPGVIDPEVWGIQEDWSGEGVTLTKPKISGLVMVPFSSSIYSVLTQPLGALGSGVGLVEQAFGNPDGSNVALQVALVQAPGGTTNYDMVLSTVYFRGRRVGVYWRDGAAMQDFTAKVDQVPFRVFGNPARASIAGDDTQGWNSQLIVDDLPTDGPHAVTFHFMASPSTVTTWLIYGLLLESRMGYFTPPPSMTPGAKVTLTTAQVALSIGTSPFPMRRINKISYLNTTGNPQTVTLQYAGNTVASIALGANATVDYVFDPPATNMNFTHACGNNSAVDAMVWGGG